MLLFLIHYSAGQERIIPGVVNLASNIWQEEGRTNKLQF